MSGCFSFCELLEGGFIELLEAGGADGFGLLEQVGDVGDRLHLLRRKFNKRCLECLARAVLLQSIGEGESLIHLVVLKDIQAAI